MDLFEDWLLAHSAGYDVKISDPKSRVLQIQGPASIDIMKAASNGKINEICSTIDLDFFDLGEQTYMFQDQVLLTSLGLKFTLMDLKLIIWHYGIIL